MRLNMKLESLAHRTDLIFVLFNGEVYDRGDYVVVRAEHNPDWHWGNFLIFPRAPAPGDHEVWLELFDREIASQQPTSHVALGWAGEEPGHVQPFLDQGFGLDPSIIQVARKVHAPPRQNDEVDVRLLTSDADWHQALENQIACADIEKYGAESYRRFKTAAMRNYRAMQDAGWGRWFGAFLGDELVADLGIFFEDNVARYQSVGTHPDHRRRGICGSLVYQSALYALEHFDVDTLVMLADPDYHAARVYESVGFIPEQRQFGLSWWRNEDAPEPSGS